MELLINKIERRLGEIIQGGEVNNTEMVRIIELVGSYLNLKTISTYAKENNMSYNGVKKFREVKKIFGVKFVVDNE